MTKEQFIKIVLDGILSPPKYFEHGVSMNKNGYQSVSDVLFKSLKKLNSKKF